MTINDMFNDTTIEDVMALMGATDPELEFSEMAVHVAYNKESIPALGTPNLLSGHDLLHNFISGSQVFPAAHTKAHANKLRELLDQVEHVPDSRWLGLTFTESPRISMWAPADEFKNAIKVFWGMQNPPADGKSTMTVDELVLDYKDEVRIRLMSGHTDLEEFVSHKLEWSEKREKDREALSARMDIEQGITRWISGADHAEAFRRALAEDFVLNEEEVLRRLRVVIQKEVVRGGDKVAIPQVAVEEELGTKYKDVYLSELGLVHENTLNSVLQDLVSELGGAA
ncbi:hypothetical protein [Nesterenkonia alba]|uniref:hypothetical protein n=1 Tax=Nesterenkonia alba TaxID=515814 RepID=UPI0003B78AC2|nr:hypothetical protein [Nesterenkonia alba]